MIPRATYRLQLHAGFTFADAAAIVPYLADLGVSHVYASPVTTAAPGSTHGYDVVDPTRINPELGGEHGLVALVQALRARDMGLIVDIVPNHMGVAGDSNAMWFDVLAQGQQSVAARVFDIDWPAPVLLPVLPAPLANVVAGGDLRLVAQGDALGLQLAGGVVYPVRPDDPVLAEPRGEAIVRHDPATRAGQAALTALAGRQHYRLTVWRAANDAVNWRRFFAINDLAAVRVEDPEVFAFSHQLIVDLFRHGLIDGVRVDHVDGLTDPARYCRRLRTALADAAPGRRPYIVVEKILAPDERLARDWQVDGTSGYDFMREVNALLHAPEGEAALAEAWHAISGRRRSFGEEACVARREALTWQFESQLRGCVDAFVALAHATGRDWVTLAMLRRAVEQLLWVFPVYRTYGDGTTAPEDDAPVRGTALAAARRLDPHGSKPFAGLVLDWLAGVNGGEPALAREAVRRFQQLSASIAAKGVEDTAFYRYGALLSGNEVGGDPAAPSLAIDDFHARMAARVARLPDALLATATHDHKRGADARARLSVLSAIAPAWIARARGWLDRAAPHAAGVAPGDQYMLLQTLVGAWDGPPGALLPRIVAWQEKALREAQLHSSWTEPDAAYEERCHGLAAALLGDAAFVADFGGFVAAIDPAARAATLAQVALHLTAPGVPDIYQGAELRDLSLVDPDNRRPVDFARRAALLGDIGDTSAAHDVDTAKLALTARLLGARRRHPDVFARGDYQPCRVSGARARHVVAFTREHGDASLAVAVAVRVGGALFADGGAWLDPDWWGHTRIDFADMSRAAGDIFRASPVYVRIGLKAAGTHDSTIR